MVKKKKRSKSSAKKKGAFFKKSLEKKTLKTTRFLIYNFIIFVLSLIFFSITTEEVLSALFGLVAILSGSLVLLFGVLEIILFVLNKKKK